MLLMFVESGGFIRHRASCSLAGQSHTQPHGALVTRLLHPRDPAKTRCCQSDLRPMRTEQQEDQMRKILLTALLAAFAMPILGTVLGPTAAHADIYMKYNPLPDQSDQGSDNASGDEDQ
jgi:hypothetical protein